MGPLDNLFIERNPQLPGCVDHFQPFALPVDMMLNLFVLGHLEVCVRAAASRQVASLHSDSFFHVFQVGIEGKQQALMPHVDIAFTLFQLHVGENQHAHAANSAMRAMQWQHASP